MKHTHEQLKRWLEEHGPIAGGAYGGVLSSAEAQGRNTNSIMEGWIDRGPWQYWDTLITATGTQLSASYSMFSIPIGQPNPFNGNAANTKLITNMRTSNSFPPPRCLLLFQIGFYPSSRMVKSDIDLILDNCYMEFKIDDKIFHEGQLWQFPAAVGLAGTTTNNGESVYTNGQPIAPTGRRYDDWSKYIAPLQQFSLTIYFPGTPPTMTGPAGLYMPIFLDGLTDRAVQ